MKNFVRLLSLSLMVLLLAGCSGASSMERNADAKADVPEHQFAATIRVLPYTDSRNIGNPHKIGTGAENLSGLSGLDGTDILLDQDVADLVSDAMRKRLADTGYQVVDNGAMFELSGTIRKLTYDVKARDEINISIASTLRDVATGKLLWSGIVDEKKSRFAGIVGDSKKEVVRVLKYEIGVVTRKTVDQIGGVLMAQHPDLFGIVPGAMAAPGVKVLNAPNPGAGAQTVPATTAKGKLTVGSSPKGAKVYVDEVYYGMSPLHLDMEPGIHTVTVERDGYAKVVQKVSVRQGDTTDLELKLKKR